MLATIYRISRICLFVAAVLLAGCAPGQAVAVITPAATSTNPPQPTATATLAPTLTPTLTATLTPTATPTATATPAPTATATPAQAVGKLSVGTAMFGDNLSFTSPASSLRPAAGKRFLLIFGDYTGPEGEKRIKIDSQDVALVGADGTLYPLYAGGILGGVVTQCKKCTIIDTKQGTINVMLIFELDKSQQKESFQLKFLNLPLIPIKPTTMGT